jgi:glycogen operon protein
LLGDFARRFTGSSDLYESGGRRPHASVNFVTAHDGFTLRDLVSYNDKHNEANGEQSRDGHDGNRSWNCGVEGESSDAAILALRTRQRRNLVATLLLSQGLPMLLAGDELGHTQNGNNNAYCQDNETSCLNCDAAKSNSAFTEFVARVVELRRSHPVFSRRRFLKEGEVVWLAPDAREMTEIDWHKGYARCIGIYLHGSTIERVDRRGRPVRDDDFLVLFNAHHEAIPFLLPRRDSAIHWTLVLDTALEPDPFESRVHESQSEYPLAGRSLVVLTRAA